MLRDNNCKRLPLQPLKSWQGWFENSSPALELSSSSFVPQEIKEGNLVGPNYILEAEVTFGWQKNRVRAS